jgi:hypothetical protein
VHFLNFDLCIANVLTRKLRLVFKTELERSFFFFNLTWCAKFFCKLNLQISGLVRRSKCECKFCWNENHPTRLSIFRTSFYVEFSAKKSAKKTAKKSVLKCSSLRLLTQFFGRKIFQTAETKLISHKNIIK